MKACLTRSPDRPTATIREPLSLCASLEMLDTLEVIYKPVLSHVTVIVGAHPPQCHPIFPHAAVRMIECHPSARQPILLHINLSAGFSTVMAIW